ncbi:MAG: Fe-S cluster assembly sulfur transfer protein SufU [Dehalococcoidia bacterium]
MTFDKEEFARQEDELDELYREVILEHYHSPQNKGRLPAPSVSREGFNPLCGDEVNIDLDIRDGVIEDVRFDGRGCSISQSSASMMTEAIRGLSLTEAEDLFAKFQGMMQGSDRADPVALGDLESLSGVRKFPGRVKCATLSWHALDEAIREYLESRG